MAVAALAITYLLIAVGGLVRATGSGEGCTGWPKCSAGRWLPPLEYHALIEYSHRMTAFLDIVVVGLLALVAWGGYRRIERVVRPAVAAAALIVVQAVLGGIVVKGALAPLLVTAHFGTAMVLTAVLVYVVVAAFTLDRRPAGLDSLSGLAAAAAAGALALLLVGAYVRGEGAGLAFSDWPLMDGRLIPAASSTSQALQLSHRLLAVAVGVLVAVTAARSWRSRALRPALAALSLTAAGLFVVQVMIGAVLVWSDLSQPAIVAHVVVSSLVWGTLVAAAATARVVREGRPEAVAP